jgi:hypothetical protein
VGELILSRPVVWRHSAALHRLLETETLVIRASGIVLCWEVSPACVTHRLPVRSALVLPKALYTVGGLTTVRGKCAPSVVAAVLFAVTQLCKHSFRVARHHVDCGRDGTRTFPSALRICDL